MNTARQTSTENLAVTYRRPGSDWSDKELLVQFVEALESEEFSDSDWLLARSSPSQPRSGGLNVLLFCPAREFEGDTFRVLRDSLQAKLINGLTLSSAEKGWPLPRFSVQVILQDGEDDWAYQLKLGPFQTDCFELHPNKVLAVGDESALSALLGLETLDPVFGLPAKWVTFSQSEKASQYGCLLFESAEVVMGHAINFLSTRTEHAVGLWEMKQWLTACLPSQGPQLCEQLQNHSALLLRVVRSLLSEGLHLPPAERFCEHVQLALSETTDPDGIEMLVRKEVVNDNIGSWLDENGILNVVSWKGPEVLRADQHHRMLERLTCAVEQLPQLTRGKIVLLAEVDFRQELSHTLKGIFPDLPVLAWSDLKDLSNVHTLVAVNANLSVDPPPVPTAFFSTSLP